MAQKSTEIPKSVWRGGKESKGLEGWWWHAKPEDVGAHVVRSGDTLEREQRDREDQAIKHLCLYHNSRVNSLYASGFASGRRWKDATIGPKATYNIIAALVDSATNKIAKNRVRLVYLTSGGNWSLRKRAKALKKYVNGQFEKLRIHDLMREAFTDGGIFQAGAIKFCREGESLRAERVLETELFVDENDAAKGNPTTLWQRAWVHKEVLAARFPQHKDKILALATDNPLTDRNGQGGDFVKTWEAWHLPTVVMVKDEDGKSRQELQGGRHTWAVGDITLVDEPYKRKRFPFVFWRWKMRRIGFWGEPISEGAVGSQLELNDMMRMARIANKRVAVPRVFMEASSQVTIDQFRSEIGHEVYYVGAKPTIETPVPFPPQWYQHMERIKAWAFESSGISEMFATATKPAGLDAAVAIREIADQGSERFVTVGQRYERMAIECAEQIVDLSREMYEDGVDLEGKPGERDFIEKVKWSQVRMEEDEYEIREFPTSSLPEDPAGRLQWITELYKAGFITEKDDALKLLDFPDLEDSLSLRLAAIDEVARQLEIIEDGGRYEPPDPILGIEGLRQAVSMATASFLRGRGGGMPEKALDKLIRYRDEAKALLNTQAPPPQQQAPAPAQGQGPPPGMPGPGGPNPMAHQPGPSIGGPMASPASPALPSDLPVVPAAA